MNIPILNKVIDERFLNHRLRSTSLAGVIGGVAAICLWAYRYFVNRIWSWDLFGIVAIIVAVKLTMMIWYRLTD